MRKILLVLLISIMAVTGQKAFACTNYIITKGASVDGSVMISYSADSHVLYGELYHWAAATWPAGSMLDIYEWDTGEFLGKIKQASETYNVVGNMNEYQVAIGETTYGGREELGKQTGAIMDYGSLIYIALQRSKTARDAIKVITSLVAEYGYYSSGESFSIADKNEAWIFEIIGKGEGQKGAVWVALRIPDGYVSSHANHARIMTFPLANGKSSITFKTIDKINNPEIECIYADDVITFAREKGWFNGEDKDFSFSDTYAPVDFGGARFCEVRVWSMFRKVNSQMDQYLDYVSGHNLKNRMPLWIKPDRKISVQDMWGFMRDHLEGTSLDMTKDIGAGPYGCPYRWRPLTFEVDGITYCNERATATQQCGFVFVTQSRSEFPDPIGGIFWFGVDDPSSSVFAPMYCGIREVPQAFKKGNGAMMDFTYESAFWIFNLVSNFAYTRYNVIHPDIEKVQAELEQKFYMETKEKIDKEAVAAYNKDPKAGLALITQYSVNAGKEVHEKWSDLFKFLFTKYMDGNIKERDGNKQNPKVSQPGYSEEWYRKIAEDTGDKLKVTGEAGH